MKKLIILAVLALVTLSTNAHALIDEERAYELTGVILEAKRSQEPLPLTSTRIVAWYDPKDLAVAIGLVEQSKYEAINDLINEGKGLLFKSGLQFYVQDTAFIEMDGRRSAVAQIRLKDGGDPMWVDTLDLIAAIHESPGQQKASSSKTKP